MNIAPSQMKKLFSLIPLFIVTALILAGRPCRAESPPGRQHENRFLFIVDTSSAMSVCSNEVVQNVVELMESELHGELRQGDTIGLWTYSDKLYPEFPMQIWTKAAKDDVVADMAAFLEGRAYGKRAHFDKVLPSLNQVIRNSQRLTIFLFSEGAAEFAGTPFDKEINALQKKFAHEFRASHVPFVAVLAANNGEVFSYTVNYPGLVAIPHTAYPEPPPVTNAPVAVVPPPETNAAPPPRPLRSLILSGKKPAPPPQAPAPVVVTPTPAPVVTAPAPVAPMPTPAPAPVPVAAPQPAVIQQPQTPAPKPAPIAETPAPTPAPSPVSTKTEEPAPAPPVAAPVVPAPTVAAATPSSGGQLPLFIIGFALLAIAIVLAIFLVRRNRPTNQSSLITQSIDHRR